MKQLLHRFQAGDDIFWVAGLKDIAVLGSGKSNTVELVEAKLLTPKSAKKDRQQEALSNEIQAVAGCAVQESTGDDTNKLLVLYVAVARANKVLAIYRIENPTSLFSTEDADKAPKQEATTIHKTPKRVSSLCFAKVPPAADDSENNNPLTVLVAGDLVGDVVAYSLTEATAVQTTAAKESEQESACPHRRLLLGHTASMLTSVKMTEDCKFLLSADRDEKIRISSFPFTAGIHGFLLGHEAFVSSVALCGERQCVSTGGDGYLRIWDIQACEQLAAYNLNSDEEDDGNGEDKYDDDDKDADKDDNNSENDEEDTSLIPVKLAVHDQRNDSNAFSVSVVYEGSKQLDTFSVSTNKGDTTITHSQRQELTAQPLDIVEWKESKVAVLVRDSNYLVQCTTIKNDIREEPAVMALLPGDMQPDLLPETLLEKDKDGKISMIKNTETRGPAQQMPWNDAKRKDTARTRNKRYRKRRRG